MYNELLEKVKKGEISLHEIEKTLNRKSALELRRTAVSEMTGTPFIHISNYSMEIEKLARNNIENMIGAVQVPLGVAGPLRIRGEYADGDYFIPLATTEGALVASADRGSSAITASGGASARILKDEMTRAPVFKTKDIIEAKKLVEWVGENFGKLKQKAESTTHFGKLLSVNAFTAGRNVYLRFSYDTKDAMGMNMATIATDAAVEAVLSENDVELVALSGNMCSDKKPAAINSVIGRGKTVSADVFLIDSVISEILKTTPEKMAEVNYRKNLLGSARAGSMGFNSHAANIAAAIFIACGQDAAHVVEASSAITTMELTDEGLYCAVTLPSLNVGTVGGGTQIGSQRECLQMLGAAGAGDPPGTNSKKLAEIVACAVLAGEISLLGALAAGHLARAHAELGRSKVK